MTRRYPESPRHDPERIMLSSLRSALKRAQLSPVEDDTLAGPALFVRMPGTLELIIQAVADQAHEPFYTLTLADRLDTSKPDADMRTSPVGRMYRAQDVVTLALAFRRARADEL